MGVWRGRKGGREGGRQAVREGGNEGEREGGREGERQGLLTYLLEVSGDEELALDPLQGLGRVVVCLRTR